ncbi:hypothetical protein H4S02_002781, partial [Coemansia sp. RSA 2611]
KKIRRRRQRSLFSMTAAGEYSLLDSGRVSSSFDPMDMSRSPRLQIDTAWSNGDLDAREPPSLDLLAEMIKEEIRQASSLKQALERVHTETESISQRVSHLSLGDDVDADRLSQRNGASIPVGKPQRPKKQVQFVVPDDVRFRWLGIFQDPSDSEASDNDANADGGGEETTSRGTIAAAAAASAPVLAPPHHEPQVTCATSVNGQSAHASKPPAAAGFPDTAQTQSGDVGATASAIPKQASALQAQSKSAPALISDPATSSTDGTSTPDHSEDLTEIDSAFQPFTANSSLEAVYGGSRSDTRLQLAPINSSGKAAPVSRARSGSAPKNDRSDINAGGAKHMSLRGDSSSGSGSSNHSRPRLAHVLLGSDPSSATSSNTLPVSNLEAVPLSKMATVSGRANRRLSSPLTQSTEPRGNDNHTTGDLNGAGHLDPHLSKTIGRSVASNHPFTGDPRSSASNSAFSQPSLATARSAAPKRYSVLPSFVPPQLPSLPDPTPKQPTKAERGDTARTRSPPGLQRSGSTQSAAVPTVSTDSQHRRRNSHDGSSIADRGGGLAAHEAANASEVAKQAPKADPHRSEPPTPPHGLLRRVTTSSAHRKHHHHSRLFPDDHSGGILGGTKEFFKHRLRSRTHSSSLHSGDIADDGTAAKEHLPETHGSETNGVQQPRPRRRSDAEVKSRNAELPPPPPPAIPEQFQQRYPPASTGGYINTVDSLQLLHAPRPSIGDGQSEWVAVSPPPSSSSAHERESATPPNIALSHRQRRSHDDTIRASTDHKAKQHKHADGAAPDVTTTLAKPQLELARPRHAKTGSDVPGTRSRNRKNTSDSSSPPSPPLTTHNAGNTVGRSSIERVKSSPLGDEATTSPRPKVPLPPSAPQSPLLTKDYMRSDSKQASPESDSIDHHLRRLRSDRKSRR